MARQRNKPVSVFKHIDMHGGDRSQCWEWTSQLSSSGRPYFTIAGRKVLAYRLTYELTHGKELNPSIILRHKCDNEVCCNPYHLEEGTHEENMNDMKTRERHGLPHNTIKAIKRLLQAGGTTHQQIGDTFGIARRTVTDIANDKIYSHVKIE